MAINAFIFMNKIQFPLITLNDKSPPCNEDVPMGTGCMLLLHFILIIWKEQHKILQFCFFIIV